jgi:uncharacterized protein (DUF433 family)
MPGMGSLGFYTGQEAARLAKVPRSTVGYWNKTGLIIPTHRRGRVMLYSFADLRDLVVCRLLKEQGANVRVIRRALEHVQQGQHAERLTEANFGVTEDGGLVYEDGGPVRADRGGQRIFWVDLRKAYEQLGARGMRADVIELRPRDRVVIDPGIRGGAPVIRGTRIPTRLIEELVEADGLDVAEVMELYPSLTAEDVEEALDYERDLGARRRGIPAG